MENEAEIAALVALKQYFEDQKLYDYQFNKFMESKIKTLNDKIALAHLGGGLKRIEKQHEKRN